MANLPVRTARGERWRTSVEGEPLRMRADPFREVAPFPHGDEESVCFKPDFEIEKIGDSFMFKANLLGIKENEVDIAVTGDRLTISGHLYDSRACSYAGFTRAFTLPEGTDGNRQIRAALDGGVLTVTFSTLPGDDPLERWESEGGLPR
jgi:HSP20 family protein